MRMPRSVWDLAYVSSRAARSSRARRRMQGCLRSTAINAGFAQLPQRGGGGFAIRSVSVGPIFDLIPEVAKRYLGDRRECQLLAVWKANRHARTVKESTPCAFRLPRPSVCIGRVTNGRASQTLRLLPPLSELHSWTFQSVQSRRRPCDSVLSGRIAIPGAATTRGAG